MKSTFSCLLVGAGLLLSGCSGDSPDTASGPVPAAPADSVDSSGEQVMADDGEDAAESTGGTPAATTGTGILTGVIRFEGELPPPRVIQANKDAEICSAGEEEIQDVQVQNGCLAGAVIELNIKGDGLPDFVTPDEGFVLRQKDCRFSPRLLVAWDGAELIVHNDDKVEHNVNTGNWNVLQLPEGEPLRRQLDYGGNPFTRVTCNIHGWMESWVYVARSPFYAVSAEDGTFRIDGIPVGSKIRGTVTHAVLGRERIKVDITAGQATQQDVVFQN